VSLETRKSKRYARKRVLFRPQKVKYHGYEDADEDAAAKRDIDPEIPPVDHEVARNLAGQRDPRTNVQDHAKHNQHNPGDYQYFSHIQKY